MRKKTKQLITTCLIVAALTGTGTVSARADYYGIPDKVTLAQSKRSVAQGKKFEVKARTSPYEAEDDYICWEIVSGKASIKFEDSDRTGDDMDFIAVKPGTATIRCYIYGKDKDRYGDTIKVTVTSAKKDYSLKKSGSSVTYEEVWDDFDLEVKKGRSIKENQLTWKISNPDIVEFANWKKTGHEVEFFAKKCGTTKITCNYTNSKGDTKSVVYTVKVVADDDEYDD